MGECASRPEKKKKTTCKPRTAPAYGRAVKKKTTCKPRTAPAYGRAVKKKTTCKPRTASAYGRAVNNFIQQQSSRTFKISSFNKILRPSPARLNTKQHRVTQCTMFLSSDSSLRAFRSPCDRLSFGLFNLILASSNLASSRKVF